MKRTLLLTASLALSACGTAAETPDTNCAQPEQAVEQLRVLAWPVILGTVSEWDGTTASLTVSEVWRGFDLPAVVDIDAEPGRAYTVGTEYLVFPANREPPFIDTPCSATTRFTPELAALRPAQVRQVMPETPTDADLPWEWLIAAALLAAGYGLGRRIVEGRRRPESVWDPDHRIDD